MRISNYPTDTLTGDELILATDVNTSTQEYKTVNFSVDTLKTFLTTDANNGVTSIVFEGAANDAVEGTLTSVAAGSSKTYTLPNATGTVVLHDAAQTLTNKTIAISQVTELSNLTAAEGEQLENIGTSTISAAQWGWLGNTASDIQTQFNNITSKFDHTQTLSSGYVAIVNASGKISTVTSGYTPVAASDLEVLTGLTSTTSELNILDGVTSTAAELNVLDGITSTPAELNKLDGFTGVVADLNYAKDLRAEGVTASEFNYLDLTSLGVVEVERVVSADANGDVTFPTNKAIITQGNFFIKGSGETLAKFVDDGSVELYHNDSKKFETTSDGVKTSGKIQMGHGAAAADIDLASATSIQVNDSAGTINVKLNGALVGNDLSPEITVTNNNGATNGGAVVSMNAGSDHQVSVFAYKVDAAGFKFKFRNEGSTLADDTIIAINFNVIWRNT